MSNNKMVLILDYYLTLITIVIDVAVGLVIGISAILAFASFKALDDEKRRPNNILGNDSDYQMFAASTRFCNR